MKENNVISILTINEILTTLRHPQVQYRPRECPLNMQTARCWRDPGHRCTSTNRTRNLRPFVNQLSRAPPTSSAHELRPRAPPTSSAPELRPRGAITSFRVFATTQSLLISLGLLMAMHRLTPIASSTAHFRLAPSPSENLNVPFSVHFTQLYIVFIRYLPCENLYIYRL